MIRIGVWGAGHLGKIHLRLLKQLGDQFELVGLYDASPEIAEAVGSQWQVPVFASSEELLERVDAVDIVTPTLTHFLLASQAIRRFKHVFIEKPVTETYDQARQLMNLASEAGVRAMVGHVERYNPAVLALEGRRLQPQFILVERLAQYNPRGTDVSVVHDLMIHDIELVLRWMGSGIKRVSASGTPLVSESADIASARIEFHSGGAAQITTSRVAFENRRLIQIFDASGYYTLDLLQKTAYHHQLHSELTQAETIGEVVAKYESPAGERYVSRESLPVPEVNAIEAELRDFGRAIAQKSDPPITLAQAADALRVVEEVVEKMG